MSKFVESALLVYDQAPEGLVSAVLDNSCGAAVNARPLAQLLEAPLACLAGADHVVVAADLDGVKQVLQLAMEHRFSVGILPILRQGRLVRYLDLPGNREQAIELALASDAPLMDIIL